MVAIHRSDGHERASNKAFQTPASLPYPAIPECLPQERDDFPGLLRDVSFRAVGLQRRAEIPDLDALHQGPNKVFE
ncbi:hypothetical protein ROHU_015238 [Labeo rohita]|uniref:Uncharacterized protein n=1 Tax=Labeo rohita TaxID=84645 RepID=A0A498NQ21_LABRO|nr:hypothetical protein ROHU_015238 [Labeo rohita]